MAVLFLIVAAFTCWKYAKYRMLLIMLVLSIIIVVSFFIIIKRYRGSLL